MFSSWRGLPELELDARECRERGCREGRVEEEANGNGCQKERITECSGGLGGVRVSRWAEGSLAEERGCLVLHPREEEGSRESGRGRRSDLC